MITLDNSCIPVHASGHLDILSSCSQPNFDRGYCVLFQPHVEPSIPFHPVIAVLLLSREYQLV